ncbi:MAG: efflux RND transporter periplasmic adaptor subunit [Phycisphaerales bacterium]
MRPLALIPLVLSMLAAPVLAQDGAPKGPPPTPVRVAVVAERQLAPRKKVFGELRASQRSTVAAEEAGIVKRIAVAEGSRVSQGDLLAELDATSLRLELSANKAALEAAMAVVIERDAAVAREMRNLALLEKAAAEGGTNPRELADAGSDVAVAQAQAAQARASVMVIEQQGALLGRRISQLEVRAPFDGVVTRKHAESGAWIATGGSVVDLVNVVSLEGWFDVPQELLEQSVALVGHDIVPAGGEASGSIEIQTGAGAPIVGRAMRVIPEIDERSRTFHAVVTVSHDQGLLAPGLSLVAFVPQGDPTTWSMVPKDALVYQGVNTVVYAVRGGAAMPVPVRVAFPIGDLVAIDATALPAGTEVVVEGNERLMPMAPVAVIGAAAGDSSEGASK